MSTYMERWQEKQANIAALKKVAGIDGGIEAAVVYAFEPAFLREVEARFEDRYLIIPTPLLARGYTSSSRLRLRKGRGNSWRVDALFEGKYHNLLNADGEFVQEATLHALDACQSGRWVETAFIAEIYRIGDVASAYRQAVEYADTLHRRQEAQEAKPTMGTVAYEALLADIDAAEARLSELELYWYGLGLNKEGK